MWREAKAEITFEFSQLHQLLDTYRPLLTKLATVEPDAVETIAVGGILQSFYSGVENIFRRIALESSAGLPIGPAWHKDLLEAMARGETGRAAVISETLRDRLREYLAFRHVYRSAYAFVLRWDRMSAVVQQLDDILRQFETEVNAFMAQKLE